MVDVQAAPAIAPTTPTTPTTEPATPKRRGPLVIALAVVGLLLVGVVVFLAVAPESPDSGIAGCKSLVASDNVTEADYHRIRDQFAGSRSADLRDTGTAMVDLAWKFNTGGEMSEADGARLFELFTKISEVCGKHGVELAGPIG